MNSDQFEGQWHQLKGDVKSKWGELTDDEVAQINGNRENLIGQVQSRYGKSKEDAKKEVNEFIDSL